MPAPTYATEPELADWILGNGCLGQTAAALDWSGQSDIQPAIDGALLAYGVATITDATDTAKLRAAAALAAWELVVNATVGNFHFSTDGQSFSPEQFHAQAVKRLALAEQQAAAFGIGAGVVRVTRIERIQNPYSVAASAEF